MRCFIICFWFLSLSLVSCKTATKFPDVKSCKALDYYDNAKKELKLTDKNWCGDIEDRFKLENKGNKFIYDSMLKGYWSKSDEKSYKWNEAKAYCTSLGDGWVLPDIWKLLSLFSKIRHQNEGYINQVFSDTDKNWFWSSTPRSNSDRVWGDLFRSGGVDNSRVSGDVGRARCFLSGS